VNVKRNWRVARVAAPAKINLGLNILERRKDGFHEVRTIMQSIELHDVVSVTLRRGPCTVRSPSVGDMPQDRGNLVWMVVERLWRSIGWSGEPHGVAVTVTKRIPTEAGLGGASSDAAAVLRALVRLWRPALQREVVHDVAESVGSDVPFFLDGGTAVATGRGECVRRLPSLHRLWLVIVVPSFGVSTKAAYDWWDSGFRPGLSRCELSTGWRRRLDRLTNDLEYVVTERYPEIAEMVSGLRIAGASFASMTGSGSAVCGAFQSHAAAMRGRRRVRQKGWRTLITKTVTLTEFRSLARLALIE